MTEKHWHKNAKKWLKLPEAVNLFAIYLLYIAFKYASNPLRLAIKIFSSLFNVHFVALLTIKIKTSLFWYFFVYQYSPQNSFACLLGGGKIDFGIYIKCIVCSAENKYITTDFYVCRRAMNEYIILKGLEKIFPTPITPQRLDTIIAILQWHIKIWNFCLQHLKRFSSAIIDLFQSDGSILAKCYFLIVIIGGELNKFWLCTIFSFW